MVKAETPMKPTHRSRAPHMFAKVIRMLTIAPLLALFTLILLFAARAEVFGGTAAFVLSLTFLVVLPVLGYPLQPVLPYFKHRGREGQRTLAMLLAMLGYFCGLAHAVLGRVTESLLIIYLTYFLSGVGVLVFNKLFHIRASGHACGAAGPLALLVLFFGPVALCGLLPLGLVFYASLKTGRHTLPQLMAGCLISLCALCISMLLVWLMLAL